MLEWNDLRFFLAIYRARTLAGAARTLGVEHTTVGRRLAAMERGLGATLFARTPGGFLPTESAGQILPLAEQAERAMAGIERIALGEDRRAEGLVRVTTSETFATFVSKWLAELRDRHPGITVEILSGNANLDLTRREADLAVRIAPTTQTELLCRKLSSAGWSAYAARDYVARRGKPSPVTELAGHDVIAYNDSLSQTPGAIWLEAHAQGANVVLRSGSIPAAWSAARGGLGITVVPCFLAEREAGMARLTAEVLGVGEVFLVVHPDLARVTRVRVVMDFSSNGSHAKPTCSPAAQASLHELARALGVLVRCVMAKVLGLGGLFFKARDPNALLAWYRDVLGLALTDWGGVMFSPQTLAAQAGAATLFAAFAEDSDHFDPAQKPFMLNFVVDDLDGMLARCREHGVTVLKQQEDPHGRFAHLLDPEGTKLELWQPLVPKPA